MTVFDSTLPSRVLTYFYYLACNTNCGEWVALSNTGCLASEPGRQSLKIKVDTGGNWPPNAGLIYSPSNCGCQSYYEQVTGTGCFTLMTDGNATGTTSYRFVGADDFSGCDPDNC